MALSLAVELPLLALLTVIAIQFTLQHYAGYSCRGRPGLHLFLLFAYFICIIPVPLLLCDVQSAVTSKAPNPVVLVLWTILYWVTQALSWAVLPVSKAYLELGHFSRGKRLCAAVARNLKLLLAMAATCGIMLGWAIIQRGLGSLHDMVGIGKAASNVSGLVIMTGLLGYGMVELPRQFFFRANLDKYKTWHEFKASKLWDAADTAQLDWADLQQEVNLVTREVQDDNLQRHVDTIHQLVAQVSADIQSSIPVLLTSPTDSQGRTAGQRADKKPVTEAMLIALHSRVRQTAYEVLKTEYLWHCHRMRYYLLEDVAKAQAQPANQVQRRIHPDQPRPGRLGAFIDTLEYYYWVHLRRVLFMGVGVILSCVSVLVLWSEAVTPVAPSWSIVAQLVSVMPYGILMQGAMLMVLAYVAFCAYWSLFNLKLFDMYCLVAHHSHPAHLCWAGYNLCRLILPLCFNFLTVGSLVHTDSATSAVGFSRVFGNMAAIGLLGRWFRNWFVACFLLAVALFTFCHGFSRSLAACDLGSHWDVAELPEDEVAEGRNVLRNARRKDDSQVYASPASPTDFRPLVAADQLSQYPTV